MRRAHRSIAPVLALASTCLASVVAAGCGPASQGELSLPVAPDLVAYEDAVHPYVARRCATLDCHGDPGRPLRLYAETGLRAPGIDRALPLTTVELEENVASVVGVDPLADPDHHILLLKPLAPSADGMHHVGGDDIFVTRDDPGYVCLHAWLAGTSPGDACARALGALPAPPPTP